MRHCKLEDTRAAKGKRYADSTRERAKRLYSYRRKSFQLRNGTGDKEVGPSHSEQALRTAEICNVDTGPSNVHESKPEGADGRDGQTVAPAEPVPSLHTAQVGKREPRQGQGGLSTVQRLTSVKPPLNRGKILSVPQQSPLSKHPGKVRHVLGRDTRPGKLNETVVVNSLLSDTRELDFKLITEKTFQ